MAISPYNPPPGATTSPYPKITAVKAKALPIMHGQRGMKPAGEDTDMSDGEPMDLMEVLNAQTKNKYVKDKKVGEGTYANVYLGHERDNPSALVAIKKIKVNTEYKDGITMDAIREIKHLQELHHPNIIRLHAVFSSKNQNLNLVLEYLPMGDLEMMIKDPDVHYSLPDIKAWMGMLARGVWWCHGNFVLHRDIKPNNLLIASSGEVKLADFGLARSFADPYSPMTYNVITRWYRPPELFYKARHYSGAVDVWSMGCVFAELIMRAPFMAGMSDIHQVELICQAIGTPTEDNWPGVTELEAYVAPEKVTPVQGREFYVQFFGTAGPSGVDLLMGMLKLDPRRRPSARQVLEHEWWRAEPRPRRKEELPKKRGGEEKMGEDLKRRGGEVEGEGDGKGRRDKVARKIDFGGR